MRSFGPIQKRDEKLGDEDGFFDMSVDAIVSMARSACWAKAWGDFIVGSCVSQRSIVLLVSLARRPCQLHVAPGN